MREITKRQFDAYCYARQPQVRMTAKEVAWFEEANRKLLAAVILDLTDGDYGYIILGRDSRKMFRCIWVSQKFYDSVREAAEALKSDLQKYVEDGMDVYPQGDEKEAPDEIFEKVVPDTKLHPYFKVLVGEPRFEAARNVIREIIYSYTDPDGHYIKEFQTNGFDARLWELYLYVYFHNEGMRIIRNKPSPDYHLSYYGYEVLVEAVTVNPSQNTARPDAPPPKTQEEVLEQTDNYLPIKFGSALYSKLEKKYWELPHVSGKPLVFAIHDYHALGSMMWSRTALSEYLYGMRTRIGLDANSKEVATYEPIEKHEWNGKVIPSGFFKQPGTENVSAVLFSNAATITKFNRMGKLAGLGSKEIKMIRRGYRFNSDPSALRPMAFVQDVDSDDYEESWSESLVMYHNPDAKYPVDPRSFPSITHICYNKESRTYVGIQQEYDVLSSATFVISPAGEKSSEET